MHSFFTVSEARVLMNACKINGMTFIRDGIHRTCSKVSQLMKSPFLDSECVDPKT